ncbi:hypothetical protein CL622_01720 [archaeon]|nr:hypothetical protein [archaeon]
MEPLKPYETNLDSTIQSYRNYVKSDQISRSSPWKRRIKNIALIGLTGLMFSCANSTYDESPLQPPVETSSELPGWWDEYMSKELPPLNKDGEKKSLDIDPLGRAPMKRSE